MFQKIIQPIPVTEINCELNLFSLPGPIQNIVLQIKNSLKLTQGYTPNMPFIYYSGQALTTKGKTPEKYQIVDGNLTILAAKELFNEDNSYHNINCFVLNKPEARIYSKLRHIQNKDF